MSEIERLRLEILGDKSIATEDEILNLKLDEAKTLFLILKYPYDDTITIIPNRYNNWIILCAKELYNKYGNEGIASYSENGLNVTYDQAMSIVSPNLQSKIIPKAGVPKHECT